IRIEMPAGLEEIVPAELSTRREEVPEMIELLAASDPDSTGFLPCEQPAAGLRILLAEDSQFNQLLVSAYLKQTEWTLEIAADGQAAVDKFTSGRFDLVLMDVQMPVIDGYTATR